jgi:hypothetical protein
MHAHRLLCGWARGGWVVGAGAHAATFFAPLRGGAGEGPGLSTLTWAPSCSRPSLAQPCHHSQHTPQPHPSTTLPLPIQLQRVDAQKRASQALVPMARAMRECSPPARGHGLGPIAPPPLALTDAIGTTKGQALAPCMRTHPRMRPCTPHPHARMLDFKRTLHPLGPGSLKPHRDVINRARPGQHDGANARARGPLQLSMPACKVAPNAAQIPGWILLMLHPFAVPSARACWA